MKMVITSRRGTLLPCLFPSDRKQNPDGAFDADRPWLLQRSYFTITSHVTMALGSIHRLCLHASGHVSMSLAVALSHA